jgi:hypothetical protein
MKLPNVIATLTIRTARCSAAYIPNVPISDLITQAGQSADNTDETGEGCLDNARERLKYRDLLRARRASLFPAMHTSLNIELGALLFRQATIGLTDAISQALKSDESSSGTLALSSLADHLAIQP